MKNNWQKDIHGPFGQTMRKMHQKDFGRTFAKERLMRMVAICMAADLSNLLVTGAQAYTAAAASVVLLIGYSIYSEYAKRWSNAIRNDKSTNSTYTSRAIP